MRAVAIRPVGMWASVPSVALAALACTPSQTEAGVAGCAEATAGCSAPGGSAPAPALTSLKVATWNLEWLYRTSGAGTVRRTDADYERLGAYAQRLAADVIAVQEVDGEDALRRVFDDATYDYHVASQAGVQLTGFAYRSGLTVIEHPDYAELDVGGVRNGTDLTVVVNGQPLRLLNVHLKSGCFDEPLSTPSNACTKLKAQLPILERWIDARAAANEPFLVLGDFNRRMSAGEAFYAELDDGQPANADLTLATDGHASLCWGGAYSQLIDHLVLSRDATPWVIEGSFAQLDYEAGDAPFKATLSDHCAVSIVLSPGSYAPRAEVPPSGDGAPNGDGDGDGDGAVPLEQALPIKGNVSADGRKLYHLPGCPSYEQTQIDESAGERLFSSEAEAVAAGWQKAVNCP